MGGVALGGSLGLLRSTNAAPFPHQGELAKQGWLNVKSVKPVNVLGRIILVR